MAGRFLVGRQPIFDESYGVVGYELLFRGDRTAEPGDDAMTSEILVRTALDLVLSGVVGDKRAFLEASRTFLVGDLDLPLPPERVVLEVGGRLAADDTVVEGCLRLADLGLTIAVDERGEGPAPSSTSPPSPSSTCWRSPLPPQELAGHVERLHGRGLKVVAENIETAEQLADCRRLGVALFQGYLLSRPQVVHGQDLTPARMTILRLIGKVCNPETSTRELERIVEGDPALSYRLLRVAGAGASAGLRRGVRSIREGVVLLGGQRLRSWLVLMLAADSSGATDEQASIALTRAKMCELLAVEVDPTLRDSAFTVGLVSALDLLLQGSLAGLVAHLNLADDLVEAILDHRGPLGRILADTLDWQLGQPPGSCAARPTCGWPRRGTSRPSTGPPASSPPCSWQPESPPAAWRNPARRPARPGPELGGESTDLGAGHRLGGGRGA